MTPEMLTIAANLTAGAFALIVLTWVIGRLIGLIQYAWKAPEPTSQPAELSEPVEFGHDGRDY
jgi:hypothetical protein